MLFLLIIRAGDVVRFFTDKNKIKSIIDMDLDISGTVNSFAQISLDILAEV